MKIKLFALLFLISLSIAHANIAQTKILGVRVLDSGDFMGVVANLTVEVKPGSGRVFVETKPLTEIDTQASARLAKEVACNILEYNCSNLDFFYIIHSDYQMVGGPSAGAAMTAATMAALQGINLKKDVLITGTINPGGSIGPVGGIIEKTQAAYIAGAKVLLIPKGELDENIKSLAKSKWDIDVIDVGDITDAYKYLTGYQIVRKNITNSEIASKTYTEIMKKLSNELLNQAQELYEKAEGNFNVSIASDSIKSELKEYLNLAKQEINNAEDSFSKKEYYSASSFSVRSMINSQYVIYVLTYEESEEKENELNKILGNVTLDISTFESLFLRNRKIDNLNDIEVYAVVIDRIKEAEDILKEAYNAKIENDTYKTLYLAAFAKVRENTAYSWLTLVNYFKGDMILSFNPQNVKSIAQERIEQAQTSIVYAQTVVNNSVVEQAKEHLKKAITAYNSENYVFALFEASKARATANLAMEIRALTNETIEEKLNDLEYDAKLYIKKAEEKGLLPILALSYLEFGKTLRQKDPLQSMVFFSYSRQMALISEDLVEATTGKQLVKKGAEIEVFKVKPFSTTNLIIDILILISGALLGILISFYLLEKT
ncbi:MAG: hypothetical protein J7K22_04560 [Nanoarchaeota archaeon]|nr:hypothetical protein [Nanoarchaeota archaeon]